MVTTMPDHLLPQSAYTPYPLPQLLVRGKEGPQLMCNQYDSLSGHWYVDPINSSLSFFFCWEVSARLSFSLSPGA